MQSGENPSSLLTLFTEVGNKKYKRGTKCKRKYLQFLQMVRIHMTLTNLHSLTEIKVQ